MVVQKTLVCDTNLCLKAFIVRDALQCGKFFKTKKIKQFCIPTVVYLARKGILSL